MTSTGLNKMDETRANEWNHSTFLPLDSGLSVEFPFKLQKRLITTSAVGPPQMTGPVNLHFVPHYRRSLWWRRLHPFWHCLPSSPHTGQNYFLGTGLNSCTLMGKNALRKCTTNQAGGGENKGETHVWTQQRQHGHKEEGGAAEPPVCSACVGIHRNLWVRAHGRFHCRK